MANLGNAWHIPGGGGVHERAPLETISYLIVPGFPEGPHSPDKATRQAGIEMNIDLPEKVVRGNQHRARTRSGIRARARRQGAQSATEAARRRIESAQPP